MPRSRSLRQSRRHESGGRIRANLATDGHRCTRISNLFIQMLPCPSVAHLCDSEDRCGIRKSSKKSWSRLAPSPTTPSSSIASSPGVPRILTKFPLLCISFWGGGSIPSGLSPRHNLLNHGGLRVGIILHVLPFALRQSSFALRI